MWGVGYGSWDFVMIVYGINPVIEALRTGRVTVLRVGDRGGERMRELLALAQERGVRVQREIGRAHV